MKSRFMTFLLVASVMGGAVYGQDEQANSTDLVDLLELLSADTNKEALLLSSELET